MTRRGGREYVVAARDERGRLRPGSVPGWGMSWYWTEQNLHPQRAHELSPERRMRLICAFWRAVAEGWQPDVPEDEWVGPHDPFSSA